MSVIKPAITTMLHRYNPWERVYMDALSIGQPDLEGYMHILVLIDSFSRWVEMFPLKTLEAKETVGHLIEHFGRFGEPDEIVTENGTESINEIVRNLTELAGIDHIRTTPFFHEGNGMVERENKETLRHLRNKIFDGKLGCEFRNAIPHVQRYVNTEVKSSTGTTPADIIMGSCRMLNRWIFKAPTPPEREARVNLGKWMADHLQTQLNTMKNSEEFQRLRAEMEECKAPGLVTKFQVGSYVLVRHEEQKVRARDPIIKLAPVLRGPMKVVEVDKDTYTLKDLVLEKNIKTHISNLRPFYFDNQTMDPLEIALRGTGLFIIDQILAHHGDTERVSTMDFLVHFKERGEIDNRWLKWSTVRNNRALHRCLLDQGLRALIPEDHAMEFYQEEVVKQEESLTNAEAELEEDTTGEVETQVTTMRQRLQGLRELLGKEKVKLARVRKQRTKEGKKSGRGAEGNPGNK
jgi:hypothetical protein